MISVIIPTHNRLPLWRSGWILNSLAAQTNHDLELIIMSDHSTDGTETDLPELLRSAHIPFPIRLFRVTAPTPGLEICASTFPDNCNFHAARGDVLLHLDDDCAIEPECCATLATIFRGGPRITVWLELTFHDDTGQQFPDALGIDYRTTTRNRLGWKPGPAGLITLHPQAQCLNGAAYAIPTSTMLDIGGMELSVAACHNTDTRLGQRFARNQIPQYLSSTPELRCRHWGMTWHQKHLNDKAAQNACYCPTHGPKIANGGRAFWTSTWFDHAYELITDLTTSSTTIH